MHARATREITQQRKKRKRRRDTAFRSNPSPSTIRFSPVRLCPLLFSLSTIPRLPKKSSERNGVKKSQRGQSKKRARIRARGTTKSWRRVVVVRAVQSLLAVRTVPSPSRSHIRVPSLPRPPEPSPSRRAYVFFLFRTARVGSRSRISVYVIAHAAPVCRRTACPCAVRSWTTARKRSARVQSPYT